MSDKNTYIPFEDFLEELKIWGFHIDPSQYIKIQHLLNEYEFNPDNSVNQLQFLLAAIVCNSPSQQSRFYKLFEEYIQRHEYKEIPHKLIPPGSKKGFKFPRIRDVLVGSFALYLLFFLSIFLIDTLTPQKIACPADDADIQFSHRIIDKNQNLLFLLDTVEFQKEWEGQLEFEQNLKKNDSLITWDFGDGSAPSFGNTHYYNKPGNYQVEVEINLSNNAIFKFNQCVLEGKKDIIVVENDWLDASFSFESSDDSPSSWSFTERTFIRDIDSLPEIRYNWNFGDNSKNSSEKNPQHTYDNPGDYTVKLIVEAEWPDTALRDISEQKLTSPKVLTPVGPQEQGSPKDSIAFLIFLWLGIPALIYLGLESIRILFWNTKGVIQSNQGPPFSQKLEVPFVNYDLLNSPDFDRLATQFRKRFTNSKTRTLDFPNSVKRTSLQAGFPSLVFNQRSSPAQYLFLIEQKSNNDLLADLFAQVGLALSQRDISVEVYFYSENPSYCWRKNSREGKDLFSLANMYQNYRLMIFGDGGFVLDEKGSHNEEYIGISKLWKQRAFLSTKACSSWGVLEDEISKNFTLVPSNYLGMRSILNLWNNGIQLSIEWWKREFQVRDFRERDLDQLLIELENYIGKKGIRILSGCSWYPEISLPLLIEISKSLEKEEDTKISEDLDFLTHLLKIPWFRKGQIPDEIRNLFIAQSSEKDGIQARVFFLNILSYKANLPPENSYAATELRVKEALFRFMNSNKQREDKRVLVNEIKEISPDTIEDQISLELIDQQIADQNLQYDLKGFFFRKKPLQRFLISFKSPIYYARKFGILISLWIRVILKFIKKKFFEAYSNISLNNFLIFKRRRYLYVAISVVFLAVIGLAFNSYNTGLRETYNEKKGSAKAMVRGGYFTKVFEYLDEIPEKFQDEKDVVVMKEMTGFIQNMNGFLEKADSNFNAKEWKQAEAFYLDYQSNVQQAKDKLKEIEGEVKEVFQPYFAEDALTDIDSTLEVINKELNFDFVAARVLAISNMGDSLYNAGMYSEAQELYDSARMTDMYKTAAYLAQKQRLASLGDDLQEMILVPGGKYSLRLDNGKNEKIINSFYISKFEVKNKEYVAFLNEHIGSQDINNWISIEKSDISLKNGKYMINSLYKDFPVVAVSYKGAEAYAKWSDSQLPTELEWEYAASSAGEEAFEYSGSDRARDVANYYSGYAVRAKKTGRRKANKLGIHDMSGNVWEWVNTGNGTNKVIKGGSFNRGENFVKIESRYDQPSRRIGGPKSNGSYHTNDLGFRIIRRRK